MAYRFVINAVRNANRAKGAARGFTRGANRYRTAGSRVAPKAATARQTANKSKSFLNNLGDNLKNAKNYPTLDKPILTAAGNLIRQNLVGFGLGAGFLAPAILPNIYDPKSEQRATAGRPMVDGAYDLSNTGKFFSALDQIPGLNLGFDTESLTNERNRQRLDDIKGSDIYAQAQRLNVEGADPLPGQKLSAYRAAVSEGVEGVLEEKAANRAFNNPTASYERDALRGQQEKENNLLTLKLLQDFQTRRDGLTERIDARETQDAYQMAALNQQATQFNSQLAMNERLDARKRRSDMLSGLSALGAAFVI